MPQQGKIWWAEAPDKRRPVLVVTRSDAVPVLTNAAGTHGRRDVRLFWLGRAWRLAPAGAGRLLEHLDQRTPMPARRALRLLAPLPLIAGALVVMTALPAAAATITVTTTASELNADGDCSLEEAIDAANTDAAVDACAAGSGADVIVIPAGTYTPAATLSVTDVDGVLLAGASATTTISGDDDHRILDAVAGDLTIQSLSLVDGFAGPLLADGGGAIRTAATGTLTIESSLLADNLASQGGAVQSGGGNLNVFDSTMVGNLAQFNELNGNGGAINMSGGELNVRRSTFTGNTARNAGGAILTGQDAEIERSTFNDNEGTFGGAVYTNDAILIANSTFDGNASTWDQNGIGATIEGALFTNDVQLVNLTVVDSTVGAGIDLPEAATVTNSIIAGNADGDCERAVTSLGGNVFSDESCGAGPDDAIGNPELGPLADNGGTTLTRLPGVGSIAIDGGVDEGCPEIDQRGVARPADGDADGAPVCDSGAVETAEPTPVDPGDPDDPDDPATPVTPGAPRAQAVRQTPTFVG
ncbi:MAG: choice-of-anchor Q domain-containing protein [Acidimicrobiales bacterium]